MSLDTAFSELQLRLEELRDGLLGLRLTLVEDRPTEGAGALLDRLGEAAFDLEEWAGEALAGAGRGRQAAQYPHRDVAAARAALAAGQQPFQRFQRQLTAEITGFTRVAEIAALGRERKGQWLRWVQGVKSAVEQCQGAAHDANEAFFQCWEEIAERAGSPAET